jgi:hypothetical protein
VTRLAAFRAGLACCVTLFVLAFVAAPHSCEWGLSAWFWSGVGSFAAVIAAPFVLHRELPPRRRAGVAAALAGLVLVAWIAGGALANVRIMCRLF